GTSILGRAGRPAVGGAKCRGRPSAPSGGQREASPRLPGVNRKDHSNAPENTVVAQALIRNGRFAAVGNNVSVPRGATVKRIDLKGRSEERRVGKECR